MSESKSSEGEKGCLIDNTERLREILSQTPVDVRALRDLASQGYCSHELRKKIWPLLVGLTPADIDCDFASKISLSHQYYDQVNKDVARSLFHFDVSKSESKRHFRIQRVRLARILHALFSSHPDLHYTQGFHDVCAVILLVCDQQGRRYRQEKRQYEKDVEEDDEVEEEEDNADHGDDGKNDTTTRAKNVNASSGTTSGLRRRRGDRINGSSLNSTSTSTSKAALDNTNKRASADMEEKKRKSVTTYTCGDDSGKNRKSCGNNYYLPPNYLEDDSQLSENSYDDDDDDNDDDSNADNDIAASNTDNGGGLSSAENKDGDNANDKADEDGKTDDNVGNEIDNTDDRRIAKDTNENTDVKEVITTTTSQTSPTGDGGRRKTKKPKLSVEEKFKLEEARMKRIQEQVRHDWETLHSSSSSSSSSPSPITTTSPSSSSSSSSSSPSPITTTSPPSSSSSSSPAAAPPIKKGKKKATPSSTPPTSTTSLLPDTTATTNALLSPLASRRRHRRSDTCIESVDYSDEALAYALVKRLALVYMRDTLKSSLGVVIQLLHLVLPLVRVADSELHSFLQEAQIASTFTLSWMLTWFSHNLSSLSNVCRVFDLLLASHPAMPIYLCVSVITTLRSDLLALSPDMPTVFSFVQSLPQDLDVNAVIINAMQLWNKHPPSTLFKIEQVMIPADSPLAIASPSEILKFALSQDTSNTNNSNDNNTSSSSSLPSASSSAGNTTTTKASKAAGPTALSSSSSSSFGAIQRFGALFAALRMLRRQSPPPSLPTSDPSASPSSSPAPSSASSSSSAISSSSTSSSRTPPSSLPHFDLNLARSIWGGDGMPIMSCTGNPLCLVINGLSSSGSTNSSMNGISMTCNDSINTCRPPQLQGETEGYADDEDDDFYPDIKNSSSSSFASSPRSSSMTTTNPISSSSPIRPSPQGGTSSSSSSSPLTANSHPLHPLNRSRLICHTCRRCSCNCRFWFPFFSSTTSTTATCSSLLSSTSSTDRTVPSGWDPQWYANPSTVPIDRGQPMITTSQSSSSSSSSSANTKSTTKPSLLGSIKMLLSRVSRRRLVFMLTVLIALFAVFLGVMREWGVHPPSFSSLTSSSYYWRGYRKIITYLTQYLSIAIAFLGNGTNHTS